MAERWDNMGKVRVLGIAGSPRKNSNTAFLVKEALLAAQKVEGVETDFIDLAPLRIDHCNHCDKCLEPLRTGQGAFECTNKKDGMAQVWPALEAADGLIFGAPVYLSGMNSKAKACLDRMRPYVWGGGCCYKVGGAIAVAMMEAGGGHDTTIQDIHNSLRMLEFITVSGLAQGGAGISGPPYGPTILVKRDPNVVEVEKHGWGKWSARLTGRRVAEVSRLIKLSKSALGESFTRDYCQCYHALVTDRKRLKEMLY